MTDTKEQHPASATGIVVVEFRPLVKGESLKGFVTLQLPSGLVLHDCTYHERSDGARWVGMPARCYTNKDGATSWQRLMDFASKPSHKRFQRETLKAIDEYFAMVAAARKKAL